MECPQSCRMNRECPLSRRVGRECWEKRRKKGHWVRMSGWGEAEKQAGGWRGKAALGRTAPETGRRRRRKDRRKSRLAAPIQHLRPNEKPMSSWAGPSRAFPLASEETTSLAQKIATSNELEDSCAKNNSSAVPFVY